jgi:phosphoribosyl 1,2-cyclic phosphodiesterase
MDPVGFVFQKDGIKVSVMCDAGRVTHLVRESLRGSHVLVVEANHDPEMLLNHSRPWSLKQRIRSRHGHLSNEDAGRLVADAADGNLQAVFLAHISRDCNLPRLALEAVRAALSMRGLDQVPVELTYADRVSALWEVR